MERWQGRVALITGASSGIGWATAELLSKENVKVVACARRDNLLNDLANKCNKVDNNPGKVFPYKVDLTDEGDTRKMFDWIEAHPELGKVDICMNNAGVIYSAPLSTSPYSGWKKQLDLNILALNLCTQLSVNLMIKKGVLDGQIIHVSSVCGHCMCGRKIRFYSGTKNMVTSLIEGWRLELQEMGGNNIRVAGISPGLVETEMPYAAHLDQDGEESARKMNEKTFKVAPHIKAIDVANAAKYILQQPEYCQVHDVILRSNHAGKDCNITF